MVFLSSGINQACLYVGGKVLVMIGGVLMICVIARFSVGVIA